MNIEIVLSSTENLLAYSGKVVKIIPPLDSLKIQFKLNPKKGCGRVVTKV